MVQFTKYNDNYLKIQMILYPLNKGTEWMEPLFQPLSIWIACSFRFKIELHRGDDDDLID